MGVAENVRLKLLSEGMDGPIHYFSYCRTSELAAELQNTPMFKVTEVKREGADACDKHMMVDIGIMTLIEPEPVCIVLISGDKDFVRLLTGLKDLQHKIIIVCHPLSASNKLIEVGHSVWSWPTIYKSSSRPPAPPTPPARQPSPPAPQPTQVWRAVPARQPTPPAPRPPPTEPRPTQVWRAVPARQPTPPAPRPPPPEPRPTPPAPQPTQVWRAVPARQPTPPAPRPPPPAPQPTHQVWRAKN